MRGNWEAAESLVVVPCQQVQQQQRSIMEEQPLPLHSPATPAWSGITDRIVKKEPAEHNEDKNDDSGVSPGHYTSNSASPGSQRSSSTINCSLSPGSSSSQDSNAMQCNIFDYNPESIYKNCDPSHDYERLTAMNESTQNKEREHTAMDVVSNTMKPGCDEPEVTQDAIQCPICPFITPNRSKFTEHLTAHYTTNHEMPIYEKSMIASQDPDNEQDQLKMDGMMGIDETHRASPSQDDRSEQESEEADEPGLRVPRVNSQGKVKKFRCKQCNFVAITKLGFWEHSRGHIKADKLLTCPKCPFVTEYKHHLEYHLRNHFGSKPFKCDKCSYSCVNKSMLNSHLKSHSNVYQYRCANCSYATKYCHSLKLHLRKYSHQPAMVLNADGSPNPLPIIDVYGTRRGPKQKPSTPNVKGHEDGSQMMNGGLSNSGQQEPLQLVVENQLSPMGHHLSMNPMSAMHALTSGVNQNVMGFPYGQFFTRLPVADNYKLQDNSTDKQLENLFVEYAKAMANDRMNMGYQHDLGARHFNDLSSVKICEDIPSPSTEDPVIDSPATHLEEAQTAPSTDGKMTPLDLSKPEVVAINNNNNVNNQNNNNNKNSNINMAQERIQSNGTSSNTNSPKTSGTSRRKGKAVKLDRRVVEKESDDECVEDNEDLDVSEKNSAGIDVSNEFTCQYCDIAFGNVVMYTVHMGYHGYKNPYTCNMCGHQSEDKVSFFLHIARSKHT